MGAKRVERATPRVSDDLADDGKPLEDECEFVAARITGDHSDVDVSTVQLDSCRIDRANLTGAQFHQASFVDCTIEASELSGLVLDDCDLRRVEFRDCRISGVQGQGSRFRDVAFVRCKLDASNFRMTTWERSEFIECDLADSDFYAAKLPGTGFTRCDLTEVELSRADLAGSRLLGSTLTGLKGAASLKGVAISSDQVTTVALSLFAYMKITVDYDT